MSGNNPVKILIVEDELLIAEDIRAQLERLGYEVCEITSSYEEAVEAASEYKPDIALVDIIINGTKDGIDTAKDLKNNFDLPVVFLTSHADKATVDRAKTADPDGYLVKPFNTNDLFTSIEIAFSNHIKKTEAHKPSDMPPGDSFVLKDCIFIKKDYLLVKLKFDDLRYVKSDGNYVEIFCEDKKYLIRSTLKDFLQKLPTNRFIQIHKSYAVNIEQIDAIDYSNVIIGKEEIPLSRSYAGNLKKYLPFDF